MRCNDADDLSSGNAVLQYVVIAQNGVLVDIAERTDNVVVTEFCLWVKKLLSLVSVALSIALAASVL